MGDGDEERRSPFVGEVEGEPETPLKGGATTFHGPEDMWTLSFGDPGPEAKRKRVDVVPKVGRVLLFQHRNMMHSGDDVVAGVDKGIMIFGRGSYSIDQQRYNFQFGGQVFYAIEKGKITEMLEDVAYQANTQEFWNACAGSCDQSDYRLFGAFNDGKGQPSQSSAVSHGSATTRFNGVNVINTGRKLG